MVSTKILSIVNWIYCLLAISLGIAACAYLLPARQALIVHPKYNAGKETLGRVFAISRQRVEHASNELDKYGIQLQLTSPQQAAAVFVLQHFDDSPAHKQLTNSALHFFQNANLDDAQRQEVVRILVLGSHTLSKGASLQVMKLLEQFAQAEDAQALRELRPSEEAFEAWSALLDKFQVQPSFAALNRIYNPPGGFERPANGFLGAWLVKHNYAKTPDVQKFVFGWWEYISNEDKQALSVSISSTEIAGMQAVRALQHMLDGKVVNQRLDLPPDLPESLNRQIVQLIGQVLNSNGRRGVLPELLPVVAKINQDTLWKQFETAASSSPMSLGELINSFDDYPSEQLLEVIESCVLNADSFVNNLQAIEQLALNEQLESKFHIRQRFGMQPPSSSTKLTDVEADQLINKINRNEIKIPEILQLKVGTLSPEKRAKVSTVAWNYIQAHIDTTLDVRSRFLADVYTYHATAANQAQLLALLAEPTLPIESRQGILTKLIALKSSRLDELVRSTGSNKKELISKNWSSLEPIVCRVLLDHDPNRLDADLFSLCSVHGGQLTLQTLRALRAYPELGEDQARAFEQVIANLEKRAK